MAVNDAAHAAQRTMLGNVVMLIPAAATGEVSVRCFLEKNWPTQETLWGLTDANIRGPSRTTTMTPLCSLAAASLLAPTSLLFGEPPASTQTTVELRVTSVDDGDAKLLEQLLMRQLGDRLLEDGYRVVPAGDAASVRV